MRILAIDAAAGACSAALAEDGEILARRFEAMAKGQAEALIPMIRDVMDEAGARFDGLAGLAVTVGPGTFTGVRIGLAAARGLALATGLPCHGATTLETVAAGVAPGWDGPVLVALATKRAEIHVQAFGPGRGPAAAPAALLPDAAAAVVPEGPVVLAGDAAPALAEAVLRLRPGARLRTVPPAHPDAAVLAVLVTARLRAGGALLPPEPLYLRAPDVTPSPRGGALRP